MSNLMKVESCKLPRCQVFRVNWAEKEVAYIYSYSKSIDTIVAEGEVRGVEVPADRCKQTLNHEFLGEADAILLSRTKKKQEFAEQLQAIMPDLEILDFTAISVADMEEMEAKIIDQLDRMQQALPNSSSEDMDYPEEYTILEEKLFLLEGMMHCWSQEIYADSLASTPKSVVSTPKTLLGTPLLDIRPDGVPASPILTCTPSTLPSTPTSAAGAPYKLEPADDASATSDTLEADEDAPIKAEDAQLAARARCGSVVAKKKGLRHMMKSLLPVSCFAVKMKNIL